MTESFAELFEESIAKTQLRSGAIVIGTVLEITNDMVIVNAGLKSEGVIPKIQFLSLTGEIEVAVGDQVEVALDAVEDGFGSTVYHGRRQNVTKPGGFWKQLSKQKRMSLAASTAR